MKKTGILLLLLLSILVCRPFAQELYPLSEPASNMPKGVWGLRFFSETYRELPQLRNVSAIRLMYGLTPKLTTYITALGSNHHGKKMPIEFPFHNTPERGERYNYKFDGIHFYAKYRFITVDDLNSHFRMALYAEAAIVNTTHHETESSLMMGDNTGIGGGMLTTYLKNKFAVSLTTGIILPRTYEGLSPDPISDLTDVPVRIQYGNTIQYNLSFGYLLRPKKYQSYEQTNFNIYLEFVGKIYDHALVDLFIHTDREYRLDPIGYLPALRKGYYLDISPSIQFIVKSNLRIDFAVAMPLLGRSYARMYPILHVGVQRYFYR